MDSAKALSMGAFSALIQSAGGSVVGFYDAKSGTYYDEEAIKAIIREEEDGDRKQEKGNAVRI